MGRKKLKTAPETTTKYGEGRRQKNTSSHQYNNSHAWGREKIQVHTK